MTAVDLFFNELKRMQYFIGNDMLHPYREANKMLEQQIKDAYNQGVRDASNNEQLKDISEYENAQIYYNETFKK